MSWVRGVGGLCVLVGAVWLLQGVGVIPGSFMTGSTFWAVTGAIVLVAGIVIVGVVKFRGARPATNPGERSPPPQPKQPEEAP
jgi:hypothetical protein